MSFGGSMNRHELAAEVAGHTGQSERGKLRIFIDMLTETMVLTQVTGGSVHTMGFGAFYMHSPNGRSASRSVAMSASGRAALSTKRSG